MAENKLPNLSYSKGSTALRWHTAGKEIEISTDWPIDQAMYSAKNRRVYALLISDQLARLPNKLEVFCEDGRSIRRFSPPEGYDFYLLARHAGVDVSVVCADHDVSATWPDWHFEIDDRRGVLKRLGPYK